MQVMGASAVCAEPVIEALQAASFQGHAAFVWCDGEDVTAVIGGEGEGADDVLRMVAKFCPELAR
jgi:hypothetical protein